MQETSLAIMRQQEGLSLASRGVVAPQISPDDARLAAHMLQQLKEAVLSNDDYIWAVAGKIYTDRRAAERSRQPIKGHPKKSGCLKLAQAFGLRVEVVSESWAEDGSYVDVVARATHPCGASTEDIASCEKSERRGLTRHNMRSTAFTRARNRAILALIGGGEVSGEELTAGGEIEPGVYESPGPMQPYQRKAGWLQEKSSETGPPASIDAGKKRGGRPVDDAPIRDEWTQANALIHAVAAEEGLTHADLHTLLQVESLRDVPAEDLRDCAGSIKLWASADNKINLPATLSLLRETLESAETIEDMATAWKSWLAEDGRTLSPLGKHLATKIKGEAKASFEGAVK